MCLDNSISPPSRAKCSSVEILNGAKDPSIVSEFSAFLFDDFCETLRLDAKIKLI